MTIDEITMKIKMDFEEKADEFVFYTLSNWLGQQEVCRVNKEELIEAISKQTPIRPYITDAYPHRAYCPRCYKTLCRNVESQTINNEMKYCPFCGQALEDWSEENES